MEPQEKVDALEKAGKDLRSQISILCKNADLYTEPTMNDYANMKFEYGIINKGCKNNRRPGSAFCQECSDKHHEDSKRETAV